MSSCNFLPIELHIFWFQGNVVVRQYTGTIPLLNGLSVSLNVIGVISVKLTGSIDISLWYRTSSSNVLTKFVLLFLISRVRMSKFQAQMSLSQFLILL